MPGYNDLMNPSQVPQGQVPNFQQAGAYQQTLTPVQQPAPIQEGPPTTPQELEQRKSGWMNFIDKIQNDPAIRQSILMGASQLMKGPGMGQTSAGALGQAIQLGTTAHGFYSGNTQDRLQEQQRIAIEQQRATQQGDLTKSNIEHNTAQTSGLTQQQEFARQGQSAAQRRLEAQARNEEFVADNQPTLLEDTLKTSSQNRATAAGRESYLRNMGQARIASTGPKTPAGVALLNERKSLWKAANPMQPDEDPIDYEVRASASVYNDTKAGAGAGGGNPNAIKVQALNLLLRDLDPKDPAYAVYQKQLESLGGIGETGTGTSAPTDAPKAAWETARKSVPVGGKYLGPDGKTYTRKD